MEIELLKQIASDVKTANIKLDSLSQKVADLDKQQAMQAKDIEFIKQEDAEQNKLLSEHIEGVKQVREQNILIRQQLTADILEKNSALEKRIKRLEKPGEWLKATMWLVITTGAVGYAVTQILQFLEILPK